MLLAEPPPTQGDLHFRVLGFPVRVHPFFWVISLIMGLQGASTAPGAVLSWIVAVFVSILIHELGHALLQRHFGGRPRIVLHGMGGLAICDDCERSSRAQILIALAGPGAGFLFAAAIAAVVRLSGHRIGLYFGDVPQLGFIHVRMPIMGAWIVWEAFASLQVDRMVWNLFFINILWGAVNLLPIYPLDGGHVSRELCQLRSPRAGLILSLQISMFVAIGMAMVGLSWSLYVTFMFGYFAYSSYKTLEAYRNSYY